MTSRDYIYKNARRDLKEGAFPLFWESQVVIDVHDLIGDEKRQILYNHLKLGKQPTNFRTAVKPHLEAVALHKRFIPETARRLADPVFTRRLHIHEYTLGQFVEKREQLLQEVLQGIDDDSKAGLALIYMRNDRLESPITLQPSEEQGLKRLRSDIGGCVAALEALNGSLVQLVHDEDQAFWRYKHPTIGDAYASLLVQSPELLGVYLQGTAPEKFVEQVTCGDVGIERAVIIPKSLYSLVLDRLDEFATTAYKDPWLVRWAARRGPQGFLTRRCSKEFVALYLDRHPDLLDRVAEPGLLLHAVPEVDLAVRLHELGLLPDGHRKKFIATVSKYALAGDDLYALEDLGIRGVFEAHEFDELLLRIRADVLPRLGDIRRDWQSSYPSDDRPESHMQPLIDGLEAPKGHFAEDEEATTIVAAEVKSAHQWVGENTPDDSAEKAPRKLGNVVSSDQPLAERSIFEDVDDDGGPAT